MDKNCEKYRDSHVLIRQHRIPAGHRDNPQATVEGPKEMFLNKKPVGSIREIKTIIECRKKNKELFASWVGPETFND